MNRVNLWICIFNAISAWGRDKIPTHAHLPDEASVKEFFVEDEKLHGRTLGNRYARSIQSQRTSLVTAINKAEGFHLDSLVFSLKSTSEALQSVSASPSASGGESDGELTKGDYERLIRVVNKPQSASINLGLISANSLESDHAAFRNNFDIIYVQNIFDEWTLSAIRQEVNRLWSSKDIEPNCNLNGFDRLGGYVHLSNAVPLSGQRSSLYSLIYGNEPLRLWMSAVVGTPLFPADFPIELREYGNQSRGMPCHSDVQMYADVDKNLEVVVTLSNHGQCEVSWYDRDEVKHSVWPEPNSITLVKPNAAVHCVSDTKGGFREILKFIMVGDYAKHRNFYEYVDNRCAKSNPNVVAVKQRRKARAATVKEEL